MSSGGGRALAADIEVKQRGSGCGAKHGRNAWLGPAVYVAHQSPFSYQHLIVVDNIACVQCHLAPPQAYMMIFPPLLNPMFWERPGNIPALTRLLVAYLSKAGQQIVAGGTRSVGVCGQTRVHSDSAAAAPVSCVGGHPCSCWSSGLPHSSSAAQVWPSVTGLGEPSLSVCQSACLHVGLPLSAAACMLSFGCTLSQPVCVCVCLDAVPAVQAT